MMTYQFELVQDGDNWIVDYMVEDPTGLHVAEGTKIITCIYDLSQFMNEIILHYHSTRGRD